MLQTHVPENDAAVSHTEPHVRPRVPRHWGNPNVPQRLSWQCIRGYQDPHVQNLQASARTCPEDLCGESWPPGTRLWHCGPASSNIPIGSMPINMSAGSNACLTGPLVPASLLPNVTPAVVSRQRTPESFFLKSSPPMSPAVVSRRVSLNPSSFFLPSKQPRCIHRRQVQPPLNLPGDSDAPDSLSGTRASHSSDSPHGHRRGMQIFPTAPLALLLW